MQKKLFIAFTVAVLFLIAGCRKPKEKAYHLMLKNIYKGSVTIIKPGELEEWQSNKSAIKPVLLDTRSKEEYDVSHLRGARFVDYESFAVEQVRGLPKHTPIVLYCSIGKRSQQIGEKLQEAGYEQIANLYGGIFEWVNQGFRVYNEKGETQKVHGYDRLWGFWISKGEKVYE